MNWHVLQDSMEVESDDDDYADAVQYDDIIDDDMRVTNSCKPLSIHSSVLLLCFMWWPCADRLSICLSVCRLKRVLLMAVGAYCIGRSGHTDLLQL